MIVAVVTTLTSNGVPSAKVPERKGNVLSQYHNPPGPGNACLFRIKRTYRMFPTEPLNKLNAYTRTGIMIDRNIKEG